MYQTRQDLEADIFEKEEDAKAFKQAFDLIQARLVRSQDQEDSSPLPLHKWAGATGIYDMLQVVVSHLENVHEELTQQREGLKHTRPTLRLVQESDDE